MIPSTIHTVQDARIQLPGVLRRFRERDSRGIYPFGRNRKPEAVIVPWRLYERLLETACGYDDLVLSSEFLRRRRHPSGPTATSLADLARTLNVPAPAPTRRGRGVGDTGRPVTAWPDFLSDLVRLTEIPKPDRERLMTAIVDVVYDGAAATAVAGSTGKDGLRRVMVAITGEKLLGLVFTVRDGTVELTAVVAYSELVAAGYTAEDVAEDATT